MTNRAELIEEARQHRAAVKAQPERRMGDGRTEAWLDALLAEVAERRREPEAADVLQDQVNTLVEEKYEALAESERLRAELNNWVDDKFKTPCRLDPNDRCATILACHTTCVKYAGHEDLSPLRGPPGRDGRAEVIEEAATFALEQRCERGTPWDMACVSIARCIRALLPSIETEPELGMPDEPVSEEARLVPGAMQQWFDDERAGRVRRGGEIVG